MRISLFVVTVVMSAAVAFDAHAQSKPDEAIVGAWTLNKSASDLRGGDQPSGRDGREGGDENGRRGNGFGGRRRGGGGGGGFGRGGGGFQGQQPQDQEAAQRMRDALRQEMQPPDHMTIVSSGSTIIMTTPDGHTTRLATDGTKVKDDSTGIARKTKWDGGKLVSEINGLGRGKIVETYSVEPDSKQLHVKIDVNGPRKSTETRVYDLDAR